MQGCVIILKVHYVDFSTRQENSPVTDFLTHKQTK